MQKAAWVPDETFIRSTRYDQFMRKLGFQEVDAFYDKSIRDISWFWEEVVKELNWQWTVPYNKVMDMQDGKERTKWFIDAKCNLTYNCLDRHVENHSSRNRLALVWESENGKTIKYTYRELLQQVQKVASGLQRLGVEKGDRIAIYLPLIAENVISLLAIARIGAIAVPCFSGFEADAVAMRIQDSEAKILITADGYWRRGNLVAMKEKADRAADQSPTLEKVIVVPLMERSFEKRPNQDVNWETLLTGTCTDTKLDLRAEDPFMLIYTSGTTGKPKGTVHVHAGFPIKSAFDAGIGMDVGPGDVLTWMTDMGWMMGPWMVFGALVNGATLVLYDGTPDYPNPGRLWNLVEKHGITHLGISPTLIRVLMKQENKWHQNADLSSLRVFGSTGEPWNPDPWKWLFEQVGEKKVPIFNYSGGTETSGGILANVLVKPQVPCGFNGALPGMAIGIVDENGEEVIGEVGELVLYQPWVGMTNSFWKADDRYLETYWSRFPQTWVHGDWVMEEDGQYFITGRSDDTIKIAGKRLGPAEMESVLVHHENVVEACTVGVPDPDKGESAVCFVVLRQSEADPTKLMEELKELVGSKLGKALKPKEIWIVSGLPKTRNGKVMRRVVRSAYLQKNLGDLSALENPDVVQEFQTLSPKVK
ncbi:AMP-binding protein [Risungbinella massiliensis]|uniref:AMP-binding protein n=1 Tax=Risungbinella massiliensis TaxID=1329796 RepID=UPI0005CBDA12|nr:AMP-binding protein [Risungbinella massiliensis]